MALINRITRLFTADINAVLDRMEEPEIILKQALREMEEDISKDENNEKSLLQEKSYMSMKLDDVEKRRQQIVSELDLCFDSDEIELARSHVKRKLEIQTYAKHLERKVDLINKNIIELSHKLEANKKRLSAMQQKYELLTDSVYQDINDDYFANADMKINEEDVDMAFLREKQNRGLL